MQTTDWTPEVLQQISPEVGKQESLLWVGRPSPRVRLRTRDAFLIPFAILWSGMPTWLLVSSLWRHHDLGVENLFLLPFFLIGQYLIWGRFVYEAWARKGVFYGLTNKRVLVVLTGTTRRVVEGLLAQLDSIEIQTRRNGEGTIDFRKEADSGWRSMSWNNRRMNSLVTAFACLVFYDIPQARSVYELVQQQRLHDSSAPVEKSY